MIRTMSHAIEMMMSAMTAKISTSWYEMFTVFLRGSFLRFAVNADGRGGQGDGGCKQRCEAGVDF